MTAVELDTIYLQYAKGTRTQTTLMVQFANYKGRHDFVLGDESAAWKVGTTQDCTARTVCKITTTTAEEGVLIEPLSDLT